MKITAAFVSLLPLLALESAVAFPQAPRTLNVRTTDLDFGQCPDLGIQFDPVNIIFKPTDDMYDAQTIVYSPDISSVTGPMCDILENDCQASQDAITACRAAQESSSNLAGEDAADAWNDALGVPPPPQDSTERRQSVERRQRGGQQPGDRKETQSATPQPVNGAVVTPGAQGKQDGKKQTDTQSPTRPAATPQVQVNEKEGKPQGGPQKDAQPGANPSTTTQAGGKQNGGKQQGGQQTDTQSPTGPAATPRVQGNEKEGKPQGGPQKDAQPGANPSTTTQAGGKQNGGKNQGGQQTGASPAAANPSATPPVGEKLNNITAAAANGTGKNFCNGKDAITNGKQVKTGSCNPIQLGEMPSSDKMLSQLITFPEPGAASGIKAGETFNISVKVANLVAGKFSNAETQ
ncbi:hypothetical protein GP486_007921 [Trichoglossum hirsutum]|uniref:Uncharacterized protein n=1 Tax=Trichoglossum hirsutum TaxID=265104 RepID=A0A9P8IAY0_9PEZI|nr:hypothetical protein GP486_007921 [Trichoglossum hirsutum]